MTSAAPSLTITYALPAVSLSGMSLSFGSQAQGSAGPGQAVTVTNTGAAPLIVSGAQVSGAQAGDYLIADGCQSPVAPGATCQIGVRFAPQATGASSAALTLISNAATAPGPIALSGTGTAPGTGPGRDPPDPPVQPDPRAQSDRAAPRVRAGRPGRSRARTPRWPGRYARSSSCRGASPRRPARGW